ncbi:MAG: allophanate hydrolase subunit 1 [Proteobacteria bacterium]|nr:allophanate hydrolase subunit 1 [Pseudomonadota bacterium]
MNSVPDSGFPRYRPAGERALLVEFGEVIDKAIHNNVLMLDERLAAEPVEGFVEAVPAYASLLIVFDPLITDHGTIKRAVADRLAQAAFRVRRSVVREVLVCYDPDFAPDLQRVAEMTGLTEEQVIAAHLAGDYSVFMYGFAPGYAYLAGVPEAIQMPRKQAAVRDVPAGSVLIAGPQCLVTTLIMPTGWWIIGRSSTRILDSRAKDRPFLFDVGDGVRFRRVAREDFERAAS